MGGERLVLRYPRRIHRQYCMKILIVEDELIIALSMRDTLTRSGHEVGALVRDERQATPIAEAFKPDLALVDWDLARGCCGGTVAKSLWHRFGVRTMFVSGHPQVCHQPGFDYIAIGCLSKPFTPEQLIDAVGAAAAVIRHEFPLRMPPNLSMYPAA